MQELFIFIALNRYINEQNPCRIDKGDAFLS
jgi:hypothetical protein